MNIQDLVPVMIYDDRCYLCSKFARVIQIVAKNKILIVGHYTEFGIKIKSEIFHENYDSTRMFWLVTKKVAYGGRAAILPLLCCIIGSKLKNQQLPYDKLVTCSQKCKTTKDFFMRTKSLLSNSEKITLKS